MLCRSTGTHLNVKQVLLTPLAHIGDSPIPVLGASLDTPHLRFISVRARESAIMRAQRSIYLIPAAAAASGSKLASVIPGMLFTSNTNGSPESESSTSTRP